MLQWLICAACIENSMLFQQQMFDVLSLPKAQLMTFDGDPLNFNVSQFA